MNKRFLNILIITSLTLVFQACGDDADTVAPSPAYSTSDYEFPSRFGDGSSVAYTGQVVRNVLIKDLKSNPKKYVHFSVFGRKNDNNK